MNKELFNDLYHEVDIELVKFYQAGYHENVLEAYARAQKVKEILQEMERMLRDRN